MIYQVWKHYIPIPLASWLSDKLAGIKKSASWYGNAIDISGSNVKLNSRYLFPHEFKAENLLLGHEPKDMYHCHLFDFFLIWIPMPRFTKPLGSTRWDTGTWIMAFRLMSNLDYCIMPLLKLGLWDHRTALQGLNAWK